jgi:methylglutaconyl-CoA hydratase
MSRATTYAVADRVATITLDRHDERNVLSPELLDALHADLEAAFNAPDVRVIVLTNRGSTFCAGADLRSAEPGHANDAVVATLRLLLDAPKPVVGRIDGHCVAGGVGLAAACDISIVRDDIRLGFTEVRVGVAPAIISVVCLPKLRRADAMELFLTGAQITGLRAAELGLVNRAVPGDRLDDEVHAVVHALLQAGPNAQRAAKSLVQRIPRMPRDVAFGWASRRSAELFRGEEAAAGIAAFRASEPPPWVPS